MILQLREVPGLAERMAALMCVDLDRRIGTEEADEKGGHDGGSLEHVLQVVEKERARVQERGSDSAAWLELEELGIDDDMLVALDLSAKFPVCSFFFPSLIISNVQVPISLICNIQSGKMVVCLF